MAGIDIISDSTGKEIVAAIQSTDVAQARILEINTAAEAKKNEVLESIPEDYSNISKEVDELKSDIDTLADIGKNHILIKGYDINKFFSTNTDGLSTTKAIKISVGDVIELRSKNNGSNASGAYAFYETDDYSRQIGDIHYMNSSPHTVSIVSEYNGYLRFAFYTDYISECYVYVNNEHHVVSLSDETKCKVTEVINDTNINIRKVVSLNDIFTTLNATHDKYLDGNGNEQSLGGYEITDYIEVDDSLEYYGWFSNAEKDAWALYFLCAYDSDKNIIKMIKENDSNVIKLSNYNAKITLPSGTTYIRMNYTNLTTGEVYFGAYNGNFEEEILNTIKKLNNRFYGKTFSVMGDSITNGYNTSKRYTEFIKEKLELKEMYNYGINGSTIANGQDSMAIRCTSMNNSDVIIIFGGTNDFGCYPTVIGDIYTEQNNAKVINYNNGTFAGAMNTLCKNLLSNFHGKEIYILSPIHREHFDEQPTDLQKNSKGLYIEKYIECMETVCKLWGVKFYNMLEEFECNPNIVSNKTTYFHDTDGLHLNATGHEKLADTIIRLLN